MDSEKTPVINFDKSYIIGRQGNNFLYAQARSKETNKWSIRIIVSIPGKVHEKWNPVCWLHEAPNFNLKESDITFDSLAEALAKLETLALQYNWEGSLCP